MMVANEFYDPFLSTRAKIAEIECAPIQPGSTVYALVPDEQGPAGDGVWHVVHVDAVDGDNVTISNRQVAPHGCGRPGPWVISRKMIYREENTR